MRPAHLLALLALLAAGTATAGDNPDPWEGFNRKVFAFNDTLDRYVMTPVARGYRAVTPAFVDRSVSHFFANLHDVADIVNYALQGNFTGSRDNALRVIGNTTVGLAGLLDPASAGGIANQDTYFGATLGKWGVGQGNYLVLPFLGPSTVRNTAGIPADWILNPLPEPWTLFGDESNRLWLEALGFVDMRADLLDYEQAIIGDRYSFVRDVYLQHDDFHVDGGAGPDPFLDEPVDDAPAGDNPPAAAPDDADAPVDAPAEAAPDASGPVEDAPAE